jgi:hypothetical protein
LRYRLERPGEYIVESRAEGGAGRNAFQQTRYIVNVGAG